MTGCWLFRAKIVILSIDTMSTMTISCPTTRYHGILAISDAVCWLGLDFVQNRVGNILWFIPLYLIYRDMPRIASRSVKVLLLTVFTWINPCIYRNPTITSIISSMGMAHNTRKSIFCHFPAKIHFRPFSTIFPRQPIFCHFLPFLPLSSWLPRWPWRETRGNPFPAIFGKCRLF